MAKNYFICEFKSDIVLHATSNTEGNIQRLDYIPGSNFLGMVARHYTSFGADAFDVFHSGKVRFGDAHILINDKESFHVPFSWYGAKGVSLEETLNGKEKCFIEDAQYGKEKCFTNDHFRDNYDNWIKKEKQPTQFRTGYFNTNGESTLLQHNYSQKSAHNREKRRSEDSSMFGYYALPKGSIFKFCVEFDDIEESTRGKITQYLTQATRLGKSRSAEYGKVLIKECENNQSEIQTNIQSNFELISGYIYIYAHSRLALTDENGINSYKPSIESLGFAKNDKVEIDYKKSNIRVGRYTPYVSARKNYDPERLYIEKGSVIAIKVESFDKNNFENNINKGIGLYLSEGFGKVIINPIFIAEEKIEFSSGTTKTKENSNKQTTINNNSLNNWLKEKKEQQEQKYKLLIDVKEFISKHNVRNKKSQWGQIRSRCNASLTNIDIYDKLFDQTKGFLTHGKALEKWDNKLIDAIKAKYKGCKEDNTDYLDFVKLLSIYAPKEDNKGDSNE